MTVNKAILVGNLGQDPETKDTSGGTVVCNFSIATSSRGKVDGEWANVTEWHNVVCFGKTAENVARFCRKGKQVYVEGKIQTRKWEDKTGNMRSKTEIVAHEVRFLGSKGDGAANQSRPNGASVQRNPGGGYGGGYGEKTGSAWEDGAF